MRSQDYYRDVKKEYHIGDIVRGKDQISYKTYAGPITWIQPRSGRILIDGCGYLFLPNEVEYLYMFIKDMEDYKSRGKL